MSNEIRHSVKKENIHNVLKFLPAFESSGFEFGKWIPAHNSEDGSTQIGWYCLTSKSIEFMEALEANGFICDFDWMDQDWQDEVQRYMGDPGLIARVELVTLVKLLHTHARAERFNEGHFGGVLESGHVTAILRRLSVFQ